MERPSQFPISRDETDPAWIQGNKLAKRNGVLEYKCGWEYIIIKYLPKCYHSDKSLKTSRRTHPKGADNRDRDWSMPVTLTPPLLSPHVLTLQCDSVSQSSALTCLLYQEYQRRESCVNPWYVITSQVIKLSKSTDPNDALASSPTCPVSLFHTLC